MGPSAMHGRTRAVCSGASLQCAASPCLLCRRLTRLAPVLVQDDEVTEAVPARRLHKLTQHQAAAVDALAVGNHQPQLLRAPGQGRHRRAQRADAALPRRACRQAAAQRQSPAARMRVPHTFANCVRRLLGSRDVISNTLGSVSPAWPYSSSTALRGSAVLSSSASTWRRSDASSRRSSCGMGVPSGAAQGGAARGRGGQAAREAGEGRACPCWRCKMACASLRHACAAATVAALLLARPCAGLAGTRPRMLLAAQRASAHHRAPCG